MYATKSLYVSKFLSESMPRNLKVLQRRSDLLAGILLPARAGARCGFTCDIRMKTCFSKTGCKINLLSPSNDLARYRSSFKGNKKLLSSQKPIISKIIDADIKIDNILENVPSYILFHYTFQDNDASKLASLVLGYPNSKQNHDIKSVTFDLVSLYEDLDFTQGEKKEILKLLFAKIFEKPNLCKIGHVIHPGAAALMHEFGISSKNLIDMQIAYEVFTGKSKIASKLDIFKFCGLEMKHSKIKDKTDIGTYPSAFGDVGDKEMLTSALSDIIPNTHLDVHGFLNCINVFFQQIQKNQAPEIEELKGFTFRQRLKIVQQATESRMEHFIAAGTLYSQQEDTHPSLSYEVIKEIKSNKKILSGRLDIFEDIGSILDLIPLEFRDELSSEASVLAGGLEHNPKYGQLRDIIMELGQRPYAYFGKQKREWICKDERFRISIKDMELLTKPILNRFGPNNRAVLDGSLHRISCMRSKTDQIYSLTYRIGRAVLGQSNMIEDILSKPSMNSSSSMQHPSVLIMGFPGTGKTTVIRDITNYLSNQMFNVIVVDTSNEICGDGLILHFSVGMARRMMVPKLDEQANVLIEAVQNHTPDVIVCDEIGRFPEVKATKTVKERGVRCIGSCHGNLKSLVNNVELNGLIGGVEEVTLGDEAAKEYQRINNKLEFSKLVKQRAGLPLFDVVIELNPGTFDEWIVIKDVSYAVDKILAGQSYPAEIRRRIPETNSFTIENISC